MSESITELKQQMCEVGRRIWQRGFCAGNEGNHSARIGDDRFLCTPTGLSKGFLEPADLIVVDGQGRQVEPNSRGRKPTSEIKVHLAIYRVRPDVRAVIHSHPPHATAFAIANVPLPEGVHPEAEVFLGKVRTARFAMPSTQALPESLLPLIKPDTNTLLMGNHGSVSFSNSLIDAYYKLEILDAYCRILILCKQIGRVNVLSRDEMAGLLKVKQQFGLSDERLACVDRGCVGEENDAFLALFEDAHPQSATCACDGGPVQCRCSDHAGAVADTRAAAGGREAPSIGEDVFEQMVQTITDQIMAAA